MGAGASGRGNHVGMPSTARWAAWLQWRFPETRVLFHSFATAGSTSLSRVTGAGLEEVAEARPDIVIWDYSSNDYSEHLFSPSGLRAVIERLARGVLSMPSKPAFLLLSLLRHEFSDRDGGWRMQDTALMPVAMHYGLPLVSYRDVVWPSLNDTSMKPLGVYSTARDVEVHILAHVHQLVADSLAFAWSAMERELQMEREWQRGEELQTAPGELDREAAGETEREAGERAEDENEVTSRSHTMHTNYSRLPPPRFIDATGDAFHAAASACKPKGWLSSLTAAATAQLSASGDGDGGVGADRYLPAGSVSSSSPRRPLPLLPVDSTASSVDTFANDTGWEFVRSPRHKEGWQFDATFNSTMSAAAPAPQFPSVRPMYGWHPEVAELARGWADLVSTLAPISFKVRFRTRTGTDGTAPAPLPRLAVSYLKSYEGFGRVLYWIGGDAERREALEQYRQHLASSLTCDHVRLECKKVAAHDYWRCLSDWPTVAGGASCIGRLRGTLDALIARGDAAAVAFDEEETPPPNVLEAHWSDHSSQLHTAGLMRFAPLDVVLSKRTKSSLAFYVPDLSLPLVKINGGNTVGQHSSRGAAAARQERHERGWADEDANEHAESEFVVNFAMLWPYVEVGHKVLAQARTSIGTSGGDGAGTAGNHGDIGRKQHEVLRDHVDCDLGRLDRLQLATVCDRRHKFKIMSLFSC